MESIVVEQKIAAKAKHETERQSEALGGSSQSPHIILALEIVIATE